MYFQRDKKRPKRSKTNECNIVNTETNFSRYLKIKFKKMRCCGTIPWHKHNLEQCVLIFRNYYLKSFGRAMLETISSIVYYTRYTADSNSSSRELVAVSSDRSDSTKKGKVRDA